MSNIRREILHVRGMANSECSSRIEEVVNDMDGIIEVKAVHFSSKVYITYDADVVDIYQIAIAIEQIGYTVLCNRAESSNNNCTNERQQERNQVSVKMEVGKMKGLKKIINKFLLKLADQNKEQFGTEKLDCCKLDRPKQSNK